MRGVYFGPFSSAARPTPSRRASSTFQDPALPDQNPVATQVIRLHLLRNENVSRALFAAARNRIRAETGRVLATLESTGTLLNRTLERPTRGRQRIARLERAAALHKRLEKVSGALHGMPEVARRIEELDAMIFSVPLEE